MFKLGDLCWVKKFTVIQTYHRRESGGEAPRRWTIFRNFWEKSYFNTIASYFARIQSHLKQKY